MNKNACSQRTGIIILISLSNRDPFSTSTYLILIIACRASLVILFLAWPEVKLFPGTRDNATSGSGAPKNNRYFESIGLAGSLV